MELRTAPLSSLHPRHTHTSHTPRYQSLWHLILHPLEGMPSEVTPSSPFHPCLGLGEPERKAWDEGLDTGNLSGKWSQETEMRPRKSGRKESEYKGVLLRLPRGALGAPIHAALVLGLSVRTDSGKMQMSAVCLTRGNISEIGSELPLTFLCSCKCIELGLRDMNPFIRKGSPAQ